MVEWSSLSEVAKDAGALTDIIFVLFGVYVWELLQTLGFELSLITRSRKFTWPLVSAAPMPMFPVVDQIITEYTYSFFVAGVVADAFAKPYSFYVDMAYCLLWLASVFCRIVSFEEKSPINCQALYTWNAITGNLAILAASSSLIIRSLALWERKIKIAIPLAILAVAHWVILWRGMFIIDAQYSPEAQGCIVVSTNHGLLMASFFSTMGVDFIVLGFTIAALTRQKIHSGLWKLLFQDGLIYFCVTFLCNAVPAILSVLNLNAVMNIIGTIPAATVSTIAACRLVMRLQEFSTNGSNSVYVNTTSANAYGANQFAVAMTHRLSTKTPEIRVTTDHYVVEDFPPVPGTSKMMEAESPMGYDDTGDSEKTSIQGGHHNV
ncbi:hypothetical protein BDW22DRAFT_1425013 [Trametopsis cervina]|nr:hypothetical protein BDW22DRAFT_1425013 [Trametopsis cervina]